MEETPAGSGGQSVGGHFRYCFKYVPAAAAELRLPITVPNPAHTQFLGRAAADPLEETRALSVQQQPPDELFRVLKKVNATRLPALS